jgi:hypothetical protein
VFKNSVLKQTFGPRRNKVTGGWRKLYNEQLHGLYSMQNITRMITLKKGEMGVHIGREEKCT